jgi:hypothetical protein
VDFAISEPPRTGRHSSLVGPRACGVERGVSTFSNEVRANIVVRRSTQYSVIRIGERASSPHPRS